MAIQWSKFKSSYMWNTTYHLRRTKFIVYQLAMILCVVSESLGTAVLSDYIDQEDYLRRQNPAAIEHNDDIVGIGSYNIFNGIYVATIFGAAFFFDLFWPERRESRAVRLAWKICAVLACVFCLASALALTVIVATHSAYVTGVPQSEANRLITDSGKHQSLVYHTNPRAVASAVFIWPGFVATVAR
ncbi:hypothetical protein H2203_000890 [Taxawa tesnikishii (nom. ined.)]|nr:hypothetical protein H2203_000890 [Dothideales sp. JES 119]